MAQTTFQGSIFVPGDITLSGAIVPGIARSSLVQDDLQNYVIPFRDWRIADNLSSMLPAPAASDDLGMDGETFGTETPFLVTSDAKATTVTQYGRFQFALPPEYVSGQSVRIQVKAGMKTTISDGTATVDFQVYESDDDGGVGADLCATAAQSINSLTQATLNFDVTATSLAAGDLLDCRMTVAITDSATSTAVLGKVSRCSVLADIKG